MTAYNFDRILRWILDSEGGNDDDKLDHGGRTSRGITQREYNAYRERENLPHGDVWKATDSEVKQIYHDSYWNPYCDDLPTGVDYLFFDMSVNAGPYRAAVMLQRAVGVRDDGSIGPLTMAAVAKLKPWKAVALFLAERLEFWTNCENWDTQGKGWTRRGAKNIRYLTQDAE